MRRTAMGRVVVSLVAALAGWTATTADAEIFVSVYGGGSFTSDAKVTHRGGSDLGRFDLDLGTAGFFGGKVGHWLDSFPYVGFELDANHGSPDIGRQTPTVAGITINSPALNGTLRLTTLSLHALVRYPLGTSKAFPSGQFQPYFGAGVGLVFGKLTLTGSGTGTLASGARAGESGTIPFSGRDSSDETPIPKVLVGLKAFLIENLSGFVEYQFAYNNLTFGGTIQGVHTGDLKTKFSSHSFSAGLSYHFDFLK